MSSEGYRIGPPRKDSDTRGCRCSGDHGYLKACWPEKSTTGGEIVEQLYVGIDVSSTKHAAYLMKPDGEKFFSFPMQNDCSGAKMISEKIVSALTKLELLGAQRGHAVGAVLVFCLDFFLLGFMRARSALRFLILALYSASPVKASLVAMVLTAIERKSFS